MTIVPYDKRKELSTPIEPTHIFILTKRGIRQKDIIDGRVSTRKLKPNRAINQQVKDLEDKILYLKENTIDLNSKIKQQDLIIKKYVTLCKKNIERINEVEILEKFRDMFVLKCMIKTGTPITVLQCSGIIKRKQCKYAPECKDRKTLLNKIF